MGLRWLAAGLLLVALALGAGVFLRRAEATALRAELATLREQAAEAQQARAERERLLAAQPPAAEVERLRADRAALVRLRAEIERLRQEVEARAGKPEPPLPREVERPALALQVEMDGQGQLMAEGQPIAFEALCERLALQPRGALVDLRFRLARDVPFASFKSTVERVKAVAKAGGLRFALRVEPATR